MNWTSALYIVFTRQSIQLIKFMIWCIEQNNIVIQVISKVVVKEIKWSKITIKMILTFIILKLMVKFLYWLTERNYCHTVNLTQKFLTFSFNFIIFTCLSQLTQHASILSQL